MAANSVLITPVGRLVWPNLNVAKAYKETQGTPSYHTKLDVEGAEGRELEALITQHAQAHAKSSGKRGSVDLSGIIMDAVDKDKNVIPDTLRFQFRVNVLETKRGMWDRKPAFYGADGQPLTPEPQIRSGTMAQIAFTVYGWLFGGRAGITLQPEGLLIHELVSNNGGREPVDRSFNALFGSAVPIGTLDSTVSGSGDF